MTPNSQAPEALAGCPSPSELAMRLNPIHSTHLVAASFLALVTSTATFAQSEASLETAASALSQGSAEVLGTLIGTGAGLSIGAVVISGAAASVVLESGADASGSALSVTLELPLEIARKLHKRRGERIQAEQSTGGTLLHSRGELIAFVPGANSQNQARREL